MTRLLSWIASWADTFRVATYGPHWEVREAVDAQAAWEAFQDDYRLKEEAEKARHGRVNDVREERKAIVHSALSRSIPTAPVAGGYSRSARAA